MKISILLPYKENYSPEYPGAVSLFVNATSKLSKYKSDIIVYGSTNYKNYLSKNYVNIKLKRNIFSSQTKQYIDNFVKTQNNDIDLIEVHNRPNYIFQINFLKKKPKPILVYSVPNEIVDKVQNKLSEKIIKYQAHNIEYRVLDQFFKP